MSLKTAVVLCALSAVVASRTPGNVTEAKVAPVALHSSENHTLNSSAAPLPSVALHNSKSLRAQDEHKITVAAQQHTIRVCNAHQSGVLEVQAWFGGVKKTLTNAPIAAKSCEQFVEMVAVGDYFEFYVKDIEKRVILPAAPVGNGAVGVFVAYEKSPKNVAIWFHYFEKLKASQVAIIDVAPPGATLAPASMVKLTCKSGICAKGKVEEMPTDHAEPLYPGHYDVVVAGESSKLDLDMEAGECYTVLRTGKNEVMAFPNAHAPTAQLMVHSSAARAGWALLSLVLFTVIA